MNMKILGIRSLLILLLIIGCTNNNKSRAKQVHMQNITPRDCVLLNDSAFKYITRYNFKHSSKDLDTALFLLKQATLCDTGYFVAYSNMANTYDAMRGYKNEIRTLNKMIYIKNSWWTLTRKGLAYQKLNDVNSANKEYTSVDSLCQSKMKKEPDNVLLIIDYITFKATAYGKIAGKKELNIQIKKHPELKSEIINATNLN